MVNSSEVNKKIIKKINESDYDESVKNFLKEIFHYELGGKNKLYTDEYIKKIRKFSKSYVD